MECDTFLLCFVREECEVFGKRYQAKFFCDNRSCHSNMKYICLKSQEHSQLIHYMIWD